MGTCLTPPARVINQDIETRLVEYKKKTTRNSHRIIVVGPKGCGKSTVCQRVQTIYHDKLLEPNDKYLNSIREDCVATTIYLLSVVKDTDSIKALKSLHMINPSDLDAVANFISNIWKKWNNFEKLLSASYLYKNEFQINDNIQYFIDNIERIMYDNINPKSESILIDEDIINYHTKFNSISHFSFETDSNWHKFEIIDVPINLQYNYKLSIFEEWIGFSRNTAAIIFVAALSEYCETLQIDRIKPENAMQSCLYDFERIVNCKYFKKCETILFLNKDDLFKKRLRSGISLSVCFGNEWIGSDYPPYEYNNNIWNIILGWIKQIEIEIKCFIPSVIGSVIVQYARKNIEIQIDHEEYFKECYEESIRFIMEKFRDKNVSVYQRVFTHVTSATNTDSMQRVLWDCQNIMMRSGLRRGGLF
eukprot:80024_1